MSTEPRLTPEILTQLETQLVTLEKADTEIGPLALRFTSLGRDEVQRYAQLCQSRTIRRDELIDDALDALPDLLAAARRDQQVRGMRERIKKGATINHLGIARCCVCLELHDLHDDDCWLRDLLAVLGDA